MSNPLSLQFKDTPSIEYGEARSPGRPMDKALKNNILKSIQTVLAREGYQHLTISKVAKTAGVSTATVYRRWPTKQDMLFDAIRQWKKYLVPTINTGSLVGDINQLIEERVRFLATPLGQTYGVLLGESVKNEEFEEILREVSVDPTREQVFSFIDRYDLKFKDDLLKYRNIFFDALFSIIHFKSFPILNSNSIDIENTILSTQIFVQKFLNNYI
ncbi:TetR/AcrR family transcriptional regulator [Swingsia samuiensis]|nr:TetR/AcrR family transcriptional regulator [Swingsia samuiensis]